MGLDYLAFKHDVTTTTVDVGDVEHVSVYSKHNGSLFISFGALYTQYLGVKVGAGLGANGALFASDPPYHGADLGWLGIELDGYIPLSRYFRLQGGAGFASVDIGHIADNSCGTNCMVVNPSPSSTTSHEGEYVSVALLIGKLTQVGASAGWLSSWIAGPFLSVGYSQYLVSNDLSRRIFISLSVLAWAP